MSNDVSLRFSDISSRKEVEIVPHAYLPRNYSPIVHSYKSRFMFIVSPMFFNSIMGGNPFDWLVWVECHERT